MKSAGNVTLLLVAIMVAGSAAGTSAAQGLYMGPSPEECQAMKSLSHLELGFPPIQVLTGHDKVAVHKNLGDALWGLNKYSEAAKEFRVAAAIAESNIGKNHRYAELAKIYWLAAVCHKHIEQYPECIQAYKRCIELQEKAYGKDADEVALTLCELGCLYRELQQWTHARDAFEREQTIFGKTRGINDSGRQLTLCSLGEIYEKLGQQELAALRYIESARVYDYLWRHNPATWHDHKEWRYGPSEKLAQLYVKQRKYADAERVYRQILNPTSFPPDQEELVDVLVAQGKIADAAKICTDYERVFRRGGDLDILKDSRFLKWCNRGSELQKLAAKSTKKSR